MSNWALNLKDLDCCSSKLGQMCQKEIFTAQRIGDMGQMCLNDLSHSTKLFDPFYNTDLNSKMWNYLNSKMWNYPFRPTKMHANHKKMGVIGRCGMYGRKKITII